MPFTFGNGELTERLRRELDIRGKTSLQLDETVVPVVLAWDASLAGHRRDGFKAWGSIRCPAVALEFGVVQLRNLGAGPFVVTHLVIKAPAGGVAQDIFVDYDTVGLAAVSTRLRTGEFSPANDPTFESQVAAGLLATSRAAAVQPGAVGKFLVTGQVVYTGVDITIPAGGILDFEAQTANTAWDLTVGGLLYTGPAR